MNFIINQYKKRFQLILETSWTLTSQIILTLLNTLLVFSLANILDPHDFGQFKFVTTWGALAFGLGYTGYTYIITQKFARNEPVFLGVLYKKTIQKSWYIFLILLAAAIYYFSKDNPLLSLGFFLIAFTTVTTLLTPLASGFYIGKRKIILNSNILLLITFFQVLTVIFLSFFTSNIYYIITAYLLTTSFGHSISIFYAYTRNKQEIGVNKISLSEMKYEEESASKLNLTSIASTLAYHSDKLLLFHFVGATQLAIYSIAIAISDQLRTPFKALSGVLLPRFSSTQNPKQKALYSFYLVTFFASLISILFFLINPYIFKYIFPKYLDYIYISNLSLLSLPFSGYNILLTYIQSQKDYTTMAWNTYIMILIMFILYPIATMQKNVELFVIFRNLTITICFTFIFYKFIKQK